MRAKRALFVALCYALAITLCFSTSIATALSEENLEKFAANNIMFYDPDPCDDKGGFSGDKLTYIGDSLSFSVKDALKTKFKNVDIDDKDIDGTTYHMVQVSKHFAMDSGDNHAGLTIAKKLVEKKQMRSFLIFALGTNDPGAVTKDKIDELVSAVGDKTKIMLVTNFGTMDSAGNYPKNNEVMTAYAKDNKNVIVADWHASASSDPDKYINDNSLGVHLSDDGKEEFVNIIYNTAKEEWMKSAGSGSGGGNNKNYAGEQVFNDDQMAKIEEFRPIYEASGQKYNVPWQVLAILHSHESSLARVNPAPLPGSENSEGLYGLHYLANVAKTVHFELGAYVDDEEFAYQTDLAAETFANYGDDLTTTDGVKHSFFRYNGVAPYYVNKALSMGFSEEEAKNGEGSPYVMNRYDARRDPKSSQMDPNWPGRFTNDTGHPDATSVSYGFGTFVEFVALGGLDDNACPDDTGDLTGYTLRYAWPDHRGTGYTTAKPEYAEAVAAKQKNKQYVGGNSMPGIDCGGFVTALIVDSGFDTEYNFGSFLSKGASSVTYGQLKWLSQTDTWQLVNPDWNTPISDEADLKPGDVAFTSCSDKWECGHTYAYVGEIDGFETHIASASLEERAPMAGKEGIIHGGKYDGIVRWFRKVK